MKKLEPTETCLVGHWLQNGKQIVKDETVERIEWLISTILVELAVSAEWGAWETLFLDPDDGRYWERTYPDGQMQGGGPPALKLISEKVARSKYKF